MKYDYKCDQCRAITEVDKRISEADTKELCPVCLVEMRKLPPTNTNFVLKGKGWYRDGYQ